jgi:hypothetical protein
LDVANALLGDDAPISVELHAKIPLKRIWAMVPEDE